MHGGAQSHRLRPLLKSLAHAQKQRCLFESPFGVTCRVRGACASVVDVAKGPYRTVKNTTTQHGNAVTAWWFTISVRAARYVFCDR